MDGEGAGVDVTDRVDQAHDPAGAAQVQSRQRLAVGREVEEGVTGEDSLPVQDEPVVELALLGLGRVQLVPHVGTAPTRAQPGQAQLGSEAVGDGLERVQLADVVPGAHHGQLGAHADVGQVLQGLHRHVVGPLAAHRVVDLGGRTVDGDLHVDVGVGGDPSRGLGVEPDAVGGELDADVVGGGVVEQLPEVGAHGRLSPADVDVEDLHALQLVDDCLGLRGRELTGVATAAAGQAVRARQVAGVGQLPRQADGRVEPEREVLDERQHGSHVRSLIMSVATRVVRARS